MRISDAACTATYRLMDFEEAPVQPPSFQGLFEKILAGKAKPGGNHKENDGEPQ